MSKNLKFILDIDNDDHYTDSLVPLRADRYIWYRLRRDWHVGDMIFLHEDLNNQLKIHACDVTSAEQLKKLVKRNFKVSPSSDAMLDKKVLLEKLCGLEKPVALIFEYDAFVQACRSANSVGKTRLMKLLEDSTGTDRCIYVRLPSRAKELEKIIHADVSGCEVLEKAFEEFGTVCTKESMSMLEAMAVCMGERFLRLDQCTKDMERMLLSISLDEPDSLKELQDQAEYLELCRTLRIGILEPEHDIDRFTPVSVAQIRQKLGDLRFRNSLRKKVGELRSINPVGSIKTAVGQEYPLPELPPFPMYEDELTRQVMSLSFQGDRLNQIRWGDELDRIKRSLTILWSTPRNRKTVELAEKLCRMTARTISNQNWSAVEACLKQLKFFAEQICVSEVYNEALEEIGKWGTYWIELQEQIRYHSNHRKSDGLDNVVSAGLERVEPKKLKLIQELVENDIYEFKPVELPADAIDRKLKANYVTYQRKIKENELLQGAEHESDCGRDRNMLLNLGEENISDRMGEENIINTVCEGPNVAQVKADPLGYNMVTLTKCEDEPVEGLWGSNRTALGFADADSVEDDLD